MISLTPKQARVMEFIRTYMADHKGAAPSFEEIGKGLGLRSKSQVHSAVKRLVERGHLRQLPNRPRALEIISMVSLCLLITGCRGARAAEVDPRMQNPIITELTYRLTICQPGYAKAIRPLAAFTREVKRSLLVEQGLAGTPVEALANSSAYVLDHVLPIELGGSPDSPHNLRLQPIEESRAKDRLEAKLHCLVCMDLMPLDEAQRVITADWKSAVPRYITRKCHYQPMPRPFDGQPPGPENREPMLGTRQMEASP